MGLLKVIFVNILIYHHIKGPRTETAYLVGLPRMNLYTVNSAMSIAATPVEIVRGRNPGPLPIYETSL